MNDDEFQALQDEQKQVAELAEAMEEAKNAGLNVDEIISEARKGYKNLVGFKMKVPGTSKVIKGNTFLLKTGLYSERHSMISALRNAVKKAKGLPTD
jgi:hypothetical protein